MKEERLDELNVLAAEYAETSSSCEKVATKAEREAEDIKKAEFMESKIGEVYDGIVSSITSFGMFVELENTVEGYVGFDKMGDEYFDYDENRKCLIGKRSGTTYKIGSKVKIRVIKASKLLKQIDFEIYDENEEEEEIII